MGSNGKPTPAVAYVRMSSGKQEASPDQQREEIAKLAKAHGYQVVREYFDSAISGDATSKRKGFQQMIADAESKGDFAVIVCWDMDRFGRFDTIEAGRWIFPLRQAGIWLHTVTQGVIDWNSFASRMIYAVQQEGKHQFLLDLSRNVLRGRLASAKRGDMVVKALYGYDRGVFDAFGNLVRRVHHFEKFNKTPDVKVRLLPSTLPGEVETIQWLFKEYADTERSLRSLVLELNERGAPARNGQWNCKSARYYLGHPAYTGGAAFGRRRSGKYFQVDDSGELAPAAGNGNGERAAPINTGGTHDALIDVETWERVQAKLNRRANRKGRTSTGGYLLTGLIACGHCGRSMIGKAGTNYKYYRCPGAMDGKCGHYHVRAEDLDRYVLDRIHERVCTPEVVEQVREAIFRKAKDRKAVRSAVATLKAQIEALDKKIARGTENILLANAADVPDLSALLAGLRADREKLQEELQDAAGRPGGRDPEAIAKQAVKELTRLRKHLESGDPERVRSVVRTMVEGIELWFERHGRYHELLRGVLSFQSGEGVLRSISSTDATPLPRGIAGPSRRPAR